jgi:hypothetical protein
MRVDSVLVVLGLVALGLVSFGTRLRAADLLLKNVEVYDGTGATHFSSDVRIRR